MDMAEKKTEFRAIEPIKNNAEKRPEWKEKICPVVNYIPKYGILGFVFDGVPCQINIAKNLKIYGTVNIKYCGDIKTGIKFKF